MQMIQSLIVTIALFITLAARAQAAEEPEKLKYMRQLYEQKSAELKLPILKELSTDLAALEQRFTDENQLEDALKARDERLRLETLIHAIRAKTATANRLSPKSPKSPKKPKAEMKEFSISPGDANLQGRLKRPQSGSYISNWVTTSCQATWSGGQIVPGFYDIYLDFDTHWYRGGGQLKFQELSQEFQCIIPTGRKRRTMKVGTFKLGTALGFTIRATSKNRYGIIRLYGVTFKPSAQQ